MTTAKRILQAKFRLSGVWQFRILNRVGPSRSARGVRGRAGNRANALPAEAESSGSVRGATEQPGRPPETLEPYNEGDSCCLACGETLRMWPNGPGHGRGWCKG